MADRAIAERTDDARSPTDRRDRRRCRARPAAARRHAPARPHPRRRAARADRRGRLRARRGDPADRDPLPARQRAPRPTRRAATSPRCSTGCRSATCSRRARVLVLLAPREHRRGRAPAPPPARRGPRRRSARSAARSATRSPRCARGRRRRRRDRALVRRCARVAGADRASDRGAAQEHPRRRARDRRDSLVDARPRRRSTPDESGRQRAPAAAARVLGLWQTAMLRLSRLQVVDEIENGLAYYRYTFLRRGAAPRTRDFDDALVGIDRRRPGGRCRPSCAWARGSAATATATRS